MRLDPFVKPLNLAVPKKGPWTYTDADTGAQFSGHSFWIVARDIWRYRMRNKRPRATYEQAQYDLLVAKRKQLGLSLTLKTEATSQPSDPIKAFYANIQNQQKKSGCKSCGKKKTATTLRTRRSRVNAPVGIPRQTGT